MANKVCSSSIYAAENEWPLKILTQLKYQVRCVCGVCMCLCGKRSVVGTIITYHNHSLVVQFEILMYLQQLILQI